MASSNDWVPLPQRKNGSNKKNKENQTKLVSQLKEMFSSAFESEIIESVAENCNWKLEQSIEALITLSSSEISEQSNNTEIQKLTYDCWRDEAVPGVDMKSLNNKNENVHEQWKDEDIRDTEKQNLSCTASNEIQKTMYNPWRNETEIENLSNNISNNDNSSYNPWKDKNILRTETLSSTNSAYNETQNFVSSSTTEELSNCQNSSTNSFLGSQNSYDLWISKELSNTKIQSESTGARKKEFLNSNKNDLLQQSEDKSVKPINRNSSSQKLNEPAQKIETASLCGLKVQYRQKGMENNSDDDADVVIEEESSDYRIAENAEPNRVNVCQFLSASTQCSPKNTFPKIFCISTPSPPSTPQRRLTQNKPPPSTALSRLEVNIERGYKILILMRGVPGSGKSYLAKTIVTKTINGDFARHIFSTDDYFIMIHRGVYAFDASRLQDAHSFNQNRILNAMKQGISPLFVDNTNTQAWEMQPYAIMAVEHGYIVETLEPNTPWFRKIHELERRNKHNVPRSKIRLMLDRYESNISGDQLLRIFSLKYAPHNRPPQLRKFPPIPVSQENLTSKVLNLSLNESSPAQPISSSQRRARKSKKSMVKDQPQRLIDNDALNTIAKEYANLEMDNDTAVTNESWTEGTSYKEDSMLDLMKLGAIGSERKAAGAKAAEENMKNVIENVSNEACAIVSINNKKNIFEEKISVSDQKTENNTENGLSQCWDFTLLLNGIQIHSTSRKPSNDYWIKMLCNSKTIFINDGKTTFLKKERIKKDSCPTHDIALTSKKIQSDIKEELDIALTSKNIQSDIKEVKTDDCSNETESANLEDNNIIDEVSSNESITPSDKTSSTNSSPEIVNEAILQKEEKESDEKKSTSALGSIFVFIKNSLLGTENEKANKNLKEDNYDEPKSDFEDRLTTKLRSSNNIASDNNSTLELSSLFNSEDVFSDTLSCKLSNVSSTSVDESNLTCETQMRNDIFSTNIDMQSEVLKDDEEYFEVKENSNSINIVEELLEASSDFQFVEQHDFTEKRFSTSNQEKTLNAVSEKPFIEEKNLQTLSKCKVDEDKVLKVPIHNIFSGKNIFPEKLQNNIGTSSKPSAINSNNSSIVGADNVNLISWRESPFPVNDAVLPLGDEWINDDAIAKRSTCDRDTNTDPYDFNVAYVGGTDDYRVLKAVNRSINGTNQPSPNDLESPSRKLMLHKGSMTNNTSVFYEEKIFEFETVADDEDRSAELLKRFTFAYIPHSFILDVYYNLCQRNFNWAVDYLDNLQDDDASLCAAIDQLKVTGSQSDTAINYEDDSKSKNMLKQRSSSSKSSTVDSNESFQLQPRQQQQQGQQRPIRSKRDRYRASGDKLILKQQLEGKFVINEETYKPHTLRVKRWKNREFDEPNNSQQVSNTIDGDLALFFDDQPMENDIPVVSGTKKLTRLDHPAVEEDEPLDEENSLEDEIEEKEETMELKLGYEFIRVLESEFGNSNFQTPENLFPVIQIRRSLAQELHALWIESMQRQLWVMQEQLDAMIAKDAEYARSLEVEEARAISEPEVPNLKEIMDMEMALATYSNDCKQKYKKETHKDLTTRVAQQTLREMYPDCDVEMLCQIFEAHGRNFDQTVKVVEENCSSKSTLTMADVLKKRKHLICELQKESRYQTSRHNELEAEESDTVVHENDSATYSLLTYDEALEIAQESRAEAHRQFKLRNENYQKASEAYRKRNPEVAAYYSDMAKLHMRNMEIANSTAASAFLTVQAHNSDDEATLDLHNLHVAEAKQALIIFIHHQLSQMKSGTRKYVSIITGRGLRSNSGYSKIKPAIASKLNSMNLNFVEVNPGKLIALLRKE